MTARCPRCDTLAELPDENGWCLDCRTVRDAAGGRDPIDLSLDELEDAYRRLDEE